MTEVNERAPVIKTQSSVPAAVNGVAVNGAKIERTPSKKSPLLPPSHASKYRKSNNPSDSSISSNGSSGSLRTAESTAQSSNWDDQLPDCPSSLGSPRNECSSQSNVSGDAKRPLTPPSLKVTDNGTRTKPLPPSPLNRTRSPGNVSGNVIIPEETQTSGELERESHEVNSGQEVSNWDVVQKEDVQGLKSENETLRQQILLLKQQQRDLKMENRVLRRNSPKPPSSPKDNGRSDTDTPPDGRTSSGGVQCVSPNESTTSYDTDNSQSSLPPTESPPTLTEQGGGGGGSVEAKKAARIQLARIIERASPDVVDQTMQPELTVNLVPIAQPVTTSVVANSSRSPNPSVTSPLSPLSPLSPAPSSTPSPTALVTFGLASQAKKRETKQSNTRKENSKKPRTETVAVPVPCPPQTDSQSSNPETRTKSNKSEATTSDSKPSKLPRLGKFAGKSDKSIVSSAAKLFQGDSVDGGGDSCGGGGIDATSNRRQVTSPEDETEREKESVSSESDEVFTSSVSQQQLPENKHLNKTLMALNRGVKSESQIFTDKSSDAGAGKSGVASKRIPIKSDVSWIKSRTKAEQEGKGERGEKKVVSVGPRSESPLCTPSPPPLRPFRSHQILNTSSPPPPPPPPHSPSSVVKPVPTPRTFNATSHPYHSGSTTQTPSFKPVAPSKKNQQSHGLVNSRIAGLIEATTDEGRSGGSSKESAKSKRRGSEREVESGMTRSASDESLQGSLRRGLAGYSSQREEVRAPSRPPRPPPYTRHQSSERFNFRPSSVMIGGNPPPRAWEEGGRAEDFSMSCIVPSSLPTAGDKSPKRRFKKSTDLNPLSKKSSLFGWRKGKTRDKDLPRIPAPALEEEVCGDNSDSSSEDEKGATIKFKPKLRPVSERKPSQLEDDFDLSYPQLFERVFVVILKQDPDTKKLATEVTYTFPPRPTAETSRDETMESIPQFCFPDIESLKPTTKFTSETFSFVLTNMEGHRRFGYCRRLLPSGRGARLPEVTCLISPLGCFSLYEKILDHIEARRQVSQASVFTFLKAMVANPFPKPGRTVQVRAISSKGGDMETVTLERPLDSRLEHVDFSLLFSTLSPRKIIQLFSSMLMERRIILCSSNLSLLTGCAHALLALIYPFEWQHVFIPILPGGLVDFCCSPMPYLMGMNPSLIPTLDEMETMEEALVVDLDKKKFVKKIGDEVSILPSKLFQYLEHTLSSQTILGEYHKPASKRSNPCRADEIVTNTFMIFFVYLYGEYKLCMKEKSDGAMEFQKKEYEQRFSSKSIRRFLEAFHMTQMFENFLEQRENPLKSETTAQSTFERRNIHDMRERCVEIEIFSSKSKISRWRLKKRI